MKNDSNLWRIAGMISSIGTEIVLLTVGGAWVGNKLDAMWNTKPWMLLIGVLVGLGSGFITAFFTLKAFVKE
ncbi:AtpZ/AtpI family protein [Laceyella putida]|uniref:AtpZ/AtpI family protein n=1 Tax=Laceyella putida TaxID=110101 RepID=A0ABW2RGF7_9BACL